MEIESETDECTTSEPDVTMAQYGAQLSSLAALEHGLPSIFEVIAQESLISTVKLAMKHVFRVLAQNNPDRFASLYRYSDELYTGLQLILENYYLKHYSASFSENFYGLKRVSQKNAEVAAVQLKEQSLSRPSEQTDKMSPAFLHLSKSQHFRSLFFLVVVPYIKNKCDLLHERLSSSQYENAQLWNQDSLKRRLCRAFLVIYPVLHAVWQGTFLVYQLAYVFGKSLHHSPFLRLAGVLLQNLTQEDLDMFSLRSTGPSLAHLMKDKRWWEALTVLVAKSASVVSMTLSTGLSVGIFFLQFLDWWYARDHDARSLLALPKPDCPKQRAMTNLPKLVTICPLCNRLRTNDTVLSVTGYVFCYPCIFRYIQEKGSCPVTGYPATPDHLVKLYLSDF